MYKKYSILIISDKTDMFETFCDYLFNFGYNVTIVDNKQKAVELVKRIFFDLIILDVQMPGVEELEVYNKIKDINPSVPIIVTIDATIEETVKEAIKKGTIAVLYKPFVSEKLLSLIKECIGITNILVVDDKYEDREGLKDLLETGNYNVFTASDGYQALEIMNNNKIDLVFLDIRIPGMDGFTVLEKIKEKNFKIPVVMITGYTTEKYLEESLVKGAYTCVYKPYPPEKIFEILEKVHKGKYVEENIKILVVDDDPATREGIVDLLELDGYIVKGVSKGEECIEIIKNEYYNIAIVDFKLPDITGLDLAKKIYKINPDIFVILLTGYASLDIAIQSVKEENIFDFITKPFNPDYLKISIKRAVEQQNLIFENRKLLKELELLSVEDGLTKLYNHRYLKNKLKEEIERSQRYGFVFSVLMSDIDFFKKYNDTYGHLAGDNILVCISQIFKENLRAVDIIARYGGDEIAVILPNTDKQNAIITAERIRSKIKEYKFVVSNNISVNLTVSIGVSTYPEDGSTEKELIEHADKALYWAKNHGRDKVCAFSSELK
jgi:two-component system cell cycle response regulator